MVVFDFEPSSKKLVQIITDYTLKGLSGSVRFAEGYEGLALRGLRSGFDMPPTTYELIESALFGCDFDNLKRRPYYSR